MIRITRIRGNAKSGCKIIILPNWNNNEFELSGLEFTKHPCEHSRSEKKERGGREEEESTMLAPNGESQVCEEVSPRLRKEQLECTLL